MAFHRIGDVIMAALPFLAFSLVCHSAAEPFPELSAEVSADRSCYAPGDTVVAALHVKVPAGFHLFANPLGPGIGKPCRLRVRSSEGIRWIGAEKTAPKKFFPEMGGWVWSYTKEACFFVKAVVSDAPPALISASFYFEGLICRTACVPVNTKNELTMTIDRKRKAEPVASFNRFRPLLATTERMEIEVVSDTAPADTLAGLPGQLSLSGMRRDWDKNQAEWNYKPVENKQAMNLILAILAGFLAGVILNAMPCVLPVLGIKLLSFAASRSMSRRTSIVRSLVFSGGMLSVFMVLAALAAFAHLSWGQHFQSPWFLVGLIALIVIFSLGLFDVYVMHVPLQTPDLEKKNVHGPAGDFLAGMFTTILATPCSGPFLGATLAWTLTQPGPVIFLVFFSIGTGMAFPYVLVSAVSSFRKLIPRPGPWMNVFKYFMGVLLLSAAIYLLFGLPKEMVGATIGFCFIVACAVVLFSKLVPFGSSLSRNIAGLTIACIVIGLGFYGMFHVFIKTKPALQQTANVEKILQWEAFTPQLLTDARLHGRHVILDFTANWCLNCQYNTIAVLTAQDVDDLIKKKHVLALKADMSLKNPEAESLLLRLGSHSVPFLAIFPGNDPLHPIIMRDIINKGRLKRLLMGLRE